MKAIDSSDYIDSTAAEEKLVTEVTGRY